MTKLHHLKLITFDVTGTLLKFRKPPFQIYQDFGIKYGIRVDPDELQQSFKTQWKLMNLSHPHFGTSWKTWWSQFVVGTFKGARMVEDVKEGELHRLAKELIQHFGTDNCWELKPGVSNLLEQLKSYNSSKRKEDRVGVGVISNFDPRLRDILQVLKISHYFNFIALSHELQMSKPNLGIFDYAYRQHFTKNSLGQAELCRQCIHIGDNYDLDYVGATSAGWKGALIMSKEQQEKELQSTLPENTVFASVQEFGEYLVK